MTQHLRLGLIGDNIAKSQSPRLHERAGRQIGWNVTYDRLVPKELGLDFDATFAHAAAHYRGVNITYPYKERVAKKVSIPDPLVAAIGAVNTVLFEPSGPQGYNTDYTGFMAAYRRIRGAEKPGRVLLLGTGGVGRAIAFGLLALEADEIRLVDADLGKAETLAEALQLARPHLKVRCGASVLEFTGDSDGIANGTPLGMVGIGGTPVPQEALHHAAWVFDAVYTPVETPFLIDAAAQGIQIISGYELFFGQGVDAFRHFSGIDIDEAQLRLVMAQEDEPA
jgi:shikimate dehydrogenase